MIALDTSALMAVVLDEDSADACVEVLVSESELVISAATVAEALIVAERRGVGEEMARLVDGLGMEIVPLGAADATRVAAAYARWGKGAHPAGLNFGDCFAYALARQLGCPLLYVGADFSQTDLASALPASNGA